MDGYFCYFIIIVRNFQSLGEKLSLWSHLLLFYISCFVHAVFPLQIIRRCLIQLEAMATALLHGCYFVAPIGLLLLITPRSICRTILLFRLVALLHVSMHERCNYMSVWVVKFRGACEYSWSSSTFNLILY